MSRSGALSAASGTGRFYDAVLNPPPGLAAAKGDGGFVTDAAITAATNVLTSASGPFTPQHVGLPVRVAGAGLGGGTMNTTIAGYTDANTVTLAGNATGTVSAKEADWGTDDTAALQAIFDWCAANRFGCTLPPRTFIVTQLAMRRYLHVQGTNYQSILRRKAGSSAHMIVIGSTGANGDFFWELDRVSIDGAKNIDGNTAADCVNLDGGTAPGKPNYWGPYKHSSVCHLHHLFIHNAPRDSVHALNALREAQFEAIFAQRAGRSNWYLETASDCFFDRCISAFAGSHGFYLSADSMHFNNCKSWWSGKDSATGNRVDTTACGYMIDGTVDSLNSRGNMFEGCEAQDNAGSGVYFLNSQGNRYYGTSNGAFNDSVTFDGAQHNDVKVTICTSVDGWISTNGVNFINGALSNRVELKTFGGTSAVTNLVGGTAVAGNSIRLQQQESLQILAYAATVTPEPRGGENIVVTLTGNITINNPTTKWPGMRMTLHFLQDAVGGHTITFNAVYKTNWTPALALNKRDVATFVWDGTNWIQTGAVTGV